MRLILLRHAEAEEKSVSDFARCLTEKGRNQAMHVGVMYRNAKIFCDVVLSSPYPRALETAKIVTQNMRNAPEVQVEEDLGCGMRPEPVLSLLRHCNEEDTVLVVGHQPDLGALCSYLTGTSGGGVFAFRKACTAIFSLLSFGPGGGVLEGFLPVKLHKLW